MQSLWKRQVSQPDHSIKHGTFEHAVVTQFLNVQATEEPCEVWVISSCCVSSWAYLRIFMASSLSGRKNS